MGKDVVDQILFLVEKGDAHTSGIDAPYEAVIGAVKRLEMQERIVAEPDVIEKAVLTEEGERIVEEGSPEYIVWAIVREHGPVPERELEKRLSALAEPRRFVGVARMQGVKKGILKVVDGKVAPIGEQEDDVRKMLRTVQSGGALESEDLSEMRKRKLVQVKKTTHYILKKGKQFGADVESLISELTVLEIAKGNYRNRLKKYNFNVVTSTLKFGGALHPLARVRDEFKKIFLEMGFEEMETNRYVESSFWNFDALFQPQNHPSRSENDTFFIKRPATSRLPDEAYVKKVSDVHSAGGYGSVGYQTPWLEKEAKKMVLRTHTTAITARKLFIEEYAKKQKPIKLFSIDKVFRNESLDATHLAEFHQIEGVVGGRGLTISHLMGFMELFFKKMGMEKIRFKPAYNPYTEPSLEVFAYHKGLKKWIEVGNSGIFRPEMLRPMGFDEDFRIMGWGLSLERPAMIKYGLKNIRDLVGHKVSLDRIRS
jgi:phenylalanyl-tRNA synthetase alpha chain